MKKLIVLSIAALAIPFSLCAQKKAASEWLHENVIVTLEIKQADQDVQKFSLVSAKKEFSFTQTMQWKKSPKEEPSTIILEYTGQLESTSTHAEQYQIDSLLVLKVPNFIYPGDKDVPFIENGWELAMKIQTGEKIDVIDNTDLKVTLSLEKQKTEQK